MEMLRSRYGFIILMIFLSGWIQAKAEYFQCPKGSKCYGKRIDCPATCPSSKYMNKKAKVCSVNCNSHGCKPRCEHVKGVKLPAKPEYFQCQPGSKCNGKHMECPHECPSVKIPNNKAKVCYVNCHSPVCKPQCWHQKANCDRPGSACHDPRFIGGDGIVFYFHGKSNQHFSLVSDASLQINGRFIGLRPAGRSRDFTWIQALGILFNSHKFTLEATKVAIWDDEIDHLKFTYNGEDLFVPQNALSIWQTPDEDIKVERLSDKNTVIVTLKDSAEIIVNVVPVTKEDDRIHNYTLPADDCFAHLEVQFRFFALSTMVDGVLGRTYRPDFENPAKPGVAMPVVGGEDEFRTSSILSADCSTCLFSPESDPNSIEENSFMAESDLLDCTHGASSGYGIVCKK